MELPLPLAILARARSVELGPVGVAAHQTQEYLAYCEARASAHQWLAELEWMLSHATPAGRMYAAYLIGSFDGERAQRAWASLENEEAIVTLGLGGCMIDSAPLGDFARGAGLPGALIGTRAALSAPGSPATRRRSAPHPPNPGLFERALTLWDNERAWIAALFWLVAGSAYVAWRILS